MKKTEYAGLQVVEVQDRQHELDSGKVDEGSLPQFSKDVPTSSRKTDHADNTTKEYTWKESLCQNIHVESITFRRSEDLGGLFRVASRDGVDSAAFVHNNAAYILRKTTKEIARAIYSTYTSACEGLESVVGWLQSVLGNVYIISKVDKACWSFDKRIAKLGHLNYTDSDDLDDDQKKSLCEMIIQKVAGLHSKGLVLGNFTIRSVLLRNDDICFTDMRGLRATRKLSYGVEEFKALMQYLFALGLMSDEEQYYAVALYHSSNEKGCARWYEEKAGKAPKEDVEVTDLMEKEIF